MRCSSSAARDHSLWAHNFIYHQFTVVRNRPNIIPLSNNPNELSSTHGSLHKLQLSDEATMTSESTRKSSRSYRTASTAASTIASDGLSCHPGLVDVVPTIINSNQRSSQASIRSSSSRTQRNSKKRIARSVSLASLESIETVMTRYPSYSQSDHTNVYTRVAGPRLRRALARDCVGKAKNMPELDDRSWPRGRPIQ